jgi:hypothetical protein
VTQRSCDAAGFQGGSGFPTNGGDFPVVQHWSGPSRDLRGRLNQSKTHRRVALTERGGLVAAAAWILAWETVLRQPKRTGGHRVEGSALRTLDSKWRRSLPHGSSKVLLWRWMTSWRREMRWGSGPRPCLATRRGGGGPTMWGTRWGPGGAAASDYGEGWRAATVRYKTKMGAHGSVRGRRKMGRPKSTVTFRIYSK